MRILIVDDSAIMRTFSREAVETVAPQAEIFGAENGESAIKYLMGMQFDLVLCDWNMPRMNGSELVRWVRSQEKMKNTPFIMLTANDQKELVMELVELGVKDYIIKPVSIDVLINRIKKVLNGQLRNQG